MKLIVFLLVFLPVTESVKHSLTYFLTASSGLQTFPEFEAFLAFDGVQVGHCDSISKRAEPRQDWVKKLNEDKPENVDWHTNRCIAIHQFSKAITEKIQQHFNQTGGVHFFQEISSCERDDKTGEVGGYQQYGYDGETFILLDLKNQRWVYTEQAVTFKPMWDQRNALLNYNIKFLNGDCIQWLNMYLEYGNSSLQRKVRPSVSLLQKSPSSPVSCHATGFYPDRATMFWRKDGEKLHEDVDHGEILPNHDGTFQMRVDLNISSIKPEDWRRYDCVFNLSGVDDIVIKLDKAVIRTNWVPPSQVPVGAVVGVVVGLMLLSVCITGLFIWWKNNNNRGRWSCFKLS
ncbi:major histocompatibility complex class I-related gene protein-like isoform X2 [Channa argus]|uniref:major histocompatibility complex class I-related gene protein-like isoform X2 n=1 Tax=Channa argus TaxID=215402 RepID=UPI003522F3B1